MQVKACGAHSLIERKASVNYYSPGTQQGVTWDCHAEYILHLPDWDFKDLFNSAVAIFFSGSRIGDWSIRSSSRWSTCRRHNAYAVLEMRVVDLPLMCHKTFLLSCLNFTSIWFPQTFFVSKGEHSPQSNPLFRHARSGNWLRETWRIGTSCSTLILAVVLGTQERGLMLAKPDALFFNTDPSYLSKAWCVARCIGAKARCPELCVSFLLACCRPDGLH